MNTIKSMLIFCAGVAVGIGVTWKRTEKHYEEMTRQAIDETKEALFEMKRKQESASTDEPSFTQKKPDISEYKQVLNENGYTQYSDSERSKVVVTEEPKGPYLISPEEFGEFGGYSTISLSYYSDGELCEDGEIIRDVEELVGANFADYFGGYEDDAVHIRNDRLKCDYEILRVNHPYADELKSKPYLREG